jgi:hypothetical protein
MVCLILIYCHAMLSVITFSKGNGPSKKIGPESEKIFRKPVYVTAGGHREMATFAGGRSCWE